MAEAPQTTAPETSADAPAPEVQQAVQNPQRQAGQHRASIDQLLKAGVHFGHLTSRWHPKMKEYIFMERNGIHILDLMQTQALLDRAAEAAARYARQGRTILFVGTKKQAREVVSKNAEACGMPYVTERWLGGMLTNFQTIRGSIRRLEELERQEQDEAFEQLKKKEKLTRAREREKLETVLSGIRHMPRLPGVLFVVDIRREHIAVDEARKLGIPIIAMVDSNVNPNLVDHYIPSNDDALKSIQLVSGVIAEAINEGKKSNEIEQEAKQAEQQKRQQEKKEAQQQGS